MRITKIKIEIEIPDDYSDVDPELTAEDFIKTPEQWTWRVSDVTKAE